MVVEAWLPVLPPVLISMGIKLESTRFAAKAVSKWVMMLPVKVAEIIRNSSQGARFFQFSKMDTFMYGLSEGAMAAMRSMSSVASSCMTSMASSTVTMPTRRSSASTTGRARKSYLLRRRAASSWSVWVLTNFTLVSMMSRRTAFLGESSSSRTVTMPPACGGCR